MNSDALFEEIHAFCDQKGYLQRLRESLDAPESERFGELDIDRSGLDLLDVVHCLVDKNRTDLLVEEIGRLVVAGDKVLEAGVGTGILSLVANQIGASVRGIELNPQVLHLAESILEHLRSRGWDDVARVGFSLGDATKHVPPAPLDLIISENIYTGMFFEKQVQIMNHLIDYLKPDGRVVPLGLQSGLSLTNLQPSPRPAAIEMLVVNELPSGFDYRELSESVIYSELDFGELNEEVVDRRINLRVSQSGDANSILIWSEVLLYGDRKIDRSDTEFMNNDILLTMPKPLSVEEGELVEVSIRYRCGSNPADAQIALRRVSGPTP